MKRFIRGCGYCVILSVVLLSIAIITVGTLAYFLFPNNGPNCQSNLRQIALGMFMYNQDYDDKLPLAIVHDETVGWANGLQPYVKSYLLFQCYAEKNPPQKFPQPNRPGFTDYWMNSNIAGLEDKKVINPGQLIMLGDGDGASPESTASYALNRLPSSWLQLPVPPMTRHLGGANYAFADGHTKWLKPNQVSQLPSSKKHPVFTFANK